MRGIKKEPRGVPLVTFTLDGKDYSVRVIGMRLEANYLYIFE